MDKYQLRLIVEEMVSAQADILEIQTNITKKQLELFTKLRGILSDIISEARSEHETETKT